MVVFVVGRLVCLYGGCIDGDVMFVFDCWEVGGGSVVMDFVDVVDLVGFL